MLVLSVASVPIIALAYPDNDSKLHKLEQSQDLMA